MKTLSKKYREDLTPGQVLQLLRESNQPFAKKLKASRYHQQKVTEKSEGQFPAGTILTRMDSLTSTEFIFG